jgi:RND family efflux transporter MFP subunit
MNVDRLKCSVVLVVCALLTALGCNKPQASTVRSDAPVPVTLAPASIQPVQRAVEVVGTLWGDEDVTISAKVPGRIASIDADMGDRAPSGEVLAQIEKTDYELAARQKELAMKEQLAKLDLREMPDDNFDPVDVPTVQRAKLQAQNAEAKYNRARDVTKEGSQAMSQMEVDDMKNAWDVARRDYDVEVLNARAALQAARSLAAQLDIARRALADTTIAAPKGSSGATTQPAHIFAVSQRMVSVGEYVKEGAALFRLVADDPVKLRASVPERYVSEIQLGQSVELIVDAYDRKFTGKVSRINPQVDAQNRTFGIEVLVPNTDHLLKPGAFARALVQTRVDPKVVFIPQQSVISFAGTNKVFTVADGKAVEKLVETGEHQGELVEVTSGLDGSEAIVVDGASKLATGVSVASRDQPRQTAGAKL